VAGQAAWVPITLERGPIFHADVLNNACTVWPRTTGRITREGEGRISRGSAMPLPQGSAAPPRPNFGGSFCRTLSQNYQIWRGNTNIYEYGSDGAWIQGSATPPPQAAWLQRSPIFGVHLYLCNAYIFYRRTYKYDVVLTHIGKGLVFTGLSAPIPQVGWAPALPNLGVRFY